MVGKRKRHHPQDVKDYLSYCMKMRRQGRPRTDVVLKWYYELLVAKGIDPLLITCADPEYGEGGSVVFPEDWVS